MSVEYFFGVPPSTDRMWCQEMASVAEFCVGRGLDPGAGNRTYDALTIRVDRFGDVRPHCVADATQLPFPSGLFDFVVSSHLLEHLAQPKQVLREWLRVVKPGGYVATIIPDTRWTRGANTDRTPHKHEWAPRDFLRDVFGWVSPFEPWWNARPTMAGGQVVQVEEACPQWSFHCVIRREG